MVSPIDEASASGQGNTIESGNTYWVDGIPPLVNFYIVKTTRNCALPLIMRV
jgi:hypothetical protein